MTFHRVLVLAAGLAVASVGPAAAQFGAPGMPDGFGYPGTPGMPGYPGMPGMPGYGSPAPQPPAMPPACQRLMALKDEAQKSGLAVQAAGKRKPTATEACKLFNTFSAAESKFARGLEENKAQCGVPDEIIKHVKAENEQVAQVRKQVCEAAAQGPQNAGPSLSDALNSTPTLPDATGPKPKTGTFDTLTGNPLIR